MSGPVIVCSWHTRERSLATEVGMEMSASSHGFLQRACHWDGHLMRVTVARAVAVSLAEPLLHQGGLGLAASRQPTAPELLLLQQGLVMAP